MPFTDIERKAVLSVAHDAARAAVDGRVHDVDLAAFPPSLRVAGATFVTLKIGGQLRGCIGTLTPERPLIVDIAENARGAVLRDPRFEPLVASDLDALEIHVSVLSRPEPMQFKSEQDLLRQLRPHIDGLILTDGYRHATFLPEVWRTLPEPREFLRRLKQKAGLIPEHWSSTITVARYTTESIT